MRTQPRVLALILSAALSNGPVLSAQPYSSTVLLINAANYCSEVYTPRSLTGYTYFRGEQIRIKVTVANRGNAQTTLHLPEAPELALVPQRPDDFKLGPLEKIGVLHRAGFEGIDWARTLRLDVDERLEFEAALETPDVPGVYAVTFESPIFDADNRRLAPQGNRFQFEVREPTQASAPAQAVRRACKAYLADNDTAAGDAIRSLLEIHPNSFVAYSMRGQLAERKRDFNEARISYERAAAILEGGLDRLYLESLAGVQSSHGPTAADFRRHAASLPR